MELVMQYAVRVYAGTLLLPWNPTMKPGTVNEKNLTPSHPNIAGLASKLGDLCEQREKGLDAFRNAWNSTQGLHYKEVYMFLQRTKKIQLPYSRSSALATQNCAAPRDTLFYQCTLATTFWTYAWHYYLDNAAWQWINKMNCKMQFSGPLGNN